MESQSFLQRPSSRADKGMSHLLMDCLPACLGRLKYCSSERSYTALSSDSGGPRLMVGARRIKGQSLSYPSNYAVHMLSDSDSPMRLLLLSVSESLPSRYLADRRHAQYTSTHMSHTWAGLWSTNAFSSLCYVMTASRRPPDRAQNASKKKP